MSAGSAAHGQISVIIAAHDEEHVIGATLDSLLAQDVDSPLEIIVSANGCTDRTVAVASRPMVRVINREAPGKAGALNAAEALATGFPRLYLDADIVVPTGGIAAMLKVLESDPKAAAVMPRRRLNVAGRPWPVRGYSAIHERLPTFRTGLFGRGMVMISEAGRARFERFPELIADDLFLDGQFSDDEKVQVDEVEVLVEAPYATADLLRRLVRVRRGNAQLRRLAATGEVFAAVRAPDRLAWLRDVVLPEPRLVFAGVTYAAVSLVAAFLARRPDKTRLGWGRDESTRRAAASNKE
ncbi:hypothetical protein MLP_48720 [Microlunatus phosphovorus NM-1]|uniref:4,4'-diaponeurosporenoate glycosyltransferase n=1 Tax=Microlunatus phosphovorus (strain ATCC 700054 / DSM 10555 / JCM 9379 / NBRC 101784 / NCIMB 13414 / VKM Ac-1990 / NM-1) TaxID=1032480 RepID=F5XFV2_MICPN|nr:glycosyltransferase family 2 protein [Microlunatus phosphovorus]BAK37886.1 hypothetical protein MLP_48720 [Microlunatus phosphovorus NM-1]